jgi:uncharacterized protein involved in exopolysaccharide biosynthesis
MAYADIDGSVPPASADEGGFLVLVNRLLQRWRLILSIAVAAGIITGLVLILGPSQYTSGGSFIPEAQSSTAGAIAAQFGLSTGESPTESADFYADILKSRTILEPALNKRFTIPDGKGVKVGTLLDLLDIRGRNPALRVENGLREMKTLVTVVPNRRTSVIRVSVTTESPELSKMVAEYLISLVGDFNLNKRQSRARIERQFLTERVDVTRAELRHAEDELEQFIESHRQYKTSPSQVFVADRLERDVRSREALFTQLQGSLEQARVDEVRKTPVITVVDSARVPAKRDARGTIGIAAAMSIAAIMATIFFLFASDWLQRGVATGDAQRIALYERLRSIRERTRSIFRKRRAT